MPRLYIPASVISLLILLVSCDSSNPVQSNLPAYSGPTGTVSGTVMAANGVTPIQGARVTVEGNFSNLPVATSDTAGAYVLTGVPTGSQTVVATKGLFRATVNITVVENQTVNAPSAQLNPTGKLAYVPGAFDAIEHIVQDTLGYAIQMLSSADLAKPETLATYRAIFLNCGMDVYSLDSAAIQAMRNYVQAGGSLYASDLAQEVVRKMFPNDVFQTDAGVSQVITATVTDASLQAFIGKTSISIAYDLGGWATLDSLSSVPKVLIRGDYTSYIGPQMNKPLAITITRGNGKVVYTTFHNEANITTDAVKVLTFFVFAL